jgi:hypothetical protein
LDFSREHSVPPTDMFLRFIGLVKGILWRLGIFGLADSAHIRPPGSSRLELLLVVVVMTIISQKTGGCDGSDKCVILVDVEPNVYISFLILAILTKTSLPTEKLFLCLMVHQAAIIVHNVSCLL